MQWLRKLLGFAHGRVWVPKPAAVPGDMNAPWEEWPGLSPFSVEWRMGTCEGYLLDWLEWYAALPSDRRAQYRVSHPEPEKWRIDEFYRRSDLFADSGDKTWRQRQQAAP